MSGILVRVWRGAWVLPIRLYQRLLSPLKGPTCRFLPSCSEYAAQAILQHGVVRGVWFGTRRILRCHPFGGVGEDPVPGTGERGRAAGPPRT
jgi:putative membrane protein insertion efficiency factor